MHVLADQSARSRALTDHESTLLIQAGAGTGKTSLLAGRVVMLLATGVAPRELVAISFTELSASELLARISRFIQELLRGEIPRDIAEALPDGFTGEQQRQLAEAEQHLDELTCTTIHGFCQILIRPYPVEADLDPGATVMDEPQAAMAFGTVFQDWLRDRLGETYGNDDVLTELVRADLDKGVRTIEQLADFMRDHRCARALQAELVSDDVAVLPAAIRAFAEWYETTPGEDDTERIIEGLRVLESLYSSQVPTPIPFGTLLQFSRPQLGTQLVTKAGTFRAYKKKGKWVAAAKAAGMSRTDGEHLFAQSLDQYDAVATAFQELQRGVASAILSAVADEFEELKERFRNLKRSSALLDFDDLLHMTRELLRASEPVRRALARRYRQILVDEFQDTDPIQAEILFLLAGEGSSNTPWHERRLRPGALFLVADPKQAIYRFRGADVETYLCARSALDTQYPGNVLEVTSNFRSASSIVDYANEHFEAVFQIPGQPGFQPLTATVDSQRHAFPPVAALDVAVGSTTDRPNAAVLRRSEALAIADACERLIDGLPIRDGHGAERRCRPGDIALLAPTGTDLWIYEHELEGRGLPVSTQAGKGLFWRQEVQDLIAVVRVLADRRDTLAFGAFMRGPLVGLTEEELLDITLSLPQNPEAHERVSYFSLRTNPAMVEHVVARKVLAILQGLARKAHSTTPAQLMSRAIEELRIRPILKNRHRAMGRAERALANVDLFLELARQYSVRGIRAFAADLTAQWEERERQAEGRVDADEDAVRLITMHSAKGLEWPVVMPINTATRLRKTEEILHRWSDDTLHMRILGLDPLGFAEVQAFEQSQAQHERARLWYVALTRARDLLVVPRLPDPPDRSWVGEIEIGLPHLPAIDLTSLEIGFQLPPPRTTNNQTSRVFAEEALQIHRVTPDISWKQPSRHEAGESTDEFHADPRWKRLPIDTAVSIRGSATRGKVLHKMLEEILLGELPEEMTACETRADELVNQSGTVPCDDPADGPNPAEIAQTALRALAVPEICEVRDRLIPEFDVFDYHSGEDEKDSALAGCADAVAIGATGEIEFVVDWKSDVSPDEQGRARYSQQVLEYLSALGVTKGIIVYMTTGQVDPVHT